MKRCTLWLSGNSLGTLDQELTLVHFSAQRKRFLWHRGCSQGLFRGYLGGVRGHFGVLKVCSGVRNGSGWAEKWTSVSPYLGRRGQSAGEEARDQGVVV